MKRWVCCRRVSETRRTWVGAQNSHLHAAGCRTLWWSLFFGASVFSSSFSCGSTEQWDVGYGGWAPARGSLPPGLLLCPAAWIKFQPETELKPVWGYCPRRDESSLFPVPRSRCFLCIMPSNYKVSQISPDLMKNELIQNELWSLETRERTEEGVGLSLLVAGCN